VQLAFHDDARLLQRDFRTPWKWWLPNAQAPKWREAAIKLIYLALQNVAKKWHTVQGWREALRQLSSVGPTESSRPERHESQNLSMK